jgi:SagB-type dehydrogenase family enzyme
VRGATRTIATSAALAAVLAVAACAAAGSDAGSVSARAGAVVRELPSPDLDGDVSLERSLVTRRSVREFGPDQPSAAQVGQLLWAAQGVTAPWGGRTAPSAGALYPLEAYAVAGREVWHYRPDGHRVEAWTDPAAAERLAVAVGQNAVANAPLLVVLTGAPERTEEKYGDRAERYVLLEVGHATQNLVLQATALGLGAVTIGAFDDDAVADALALPEGERPYYVVPIGMPAA